MVTIQTTLNFYLSLSQKFQNILSNFCLSQNFTSIIYRPLHVLTCGVGARSLPIHSKSLSSSIEYSIFNSIPTNFYLSQKFTSMKYRPLHVLTSEVGAWSLFKPLQISIYLYFKILKAYFQISVDLKILHL